MICIQDYKELFVQQADQIEDWRKISIDELMNTYIKKEKEFGADSYLAAIICKLWNRMNSYYFKNIKSATQEDCIDWMMNSIMSALRYRRWLDPNSNMYNDPKGPSKSINVSMKSSEQGFYQYSNKPKRSINYAIDSIERLQESLNGEDFLVSNICQDERFSTEYVLIQKYYEKQKIFNILVICSITFSSASPKEGELDRFVLNNLQHLDERVLYIISEKYFLDRNLLIEEFANIKNNSRYVLLKKINKAIEQIKKDILKIQEI